MDDGADDRFMDLEVKLAYQERLIRELDALVRTFGDRLDGAMRELAQLKDTIGPPEVKTEKPPHY